MVIKDNNTAPVRFKINNSVVSITGDKDKLVIEYEYMGLKSHKTYYYMHESTKSPGIFVNNKREK